MIGTCRQLTVTYLHAQALIVLLTIPSSIAAVCQRVRIIAVITEMLQASWHEQCAYLKGEPSAEHEDQDKLKILVNGPQRLHSPVSICYKEVECGRRQYLVREQ